MPTREEIAAAAKRVLTVFNDLSNPKPIAERLIWSDLGDCARVALEAMEADAHAYLGREAHTMRLFVQIDKRPRAGVDLIRRPTGGNR